MTIAEKHLLIIIDLAIDKHRKAGRVVAVSIELSNMLDKLRGFDRRAL